MILIILIMALAVFSIIVGMAVRRKSRSAMVVGAILGSVAFVATMLAAVFAMMSWDDDGYESLPLVRAGSAFLHDFANVQALDSAGNVVEFSTISSDYNVTVVGDLVDVQVEQQFFNPSDTSLNATYMFPLNSNAAVYAMEYVVGDEVIVAKIQTKQEATQTFEVAKQEGKSAALLVQERPNVFTQSLANIPPSTPVTIRIRYVHHAERRDGEYVVNLPTRVGRRYVPADMSGNTLGGEAFEANSVRLPQGMLSFRGTVSAGLNVGSFLSPTHPITSRRLGTTGFLFESGTHMPNDDFEIRWTLAGANPTASVATTYDTATDTTYFSALIEPPAQVAAADLRPREIVFLLDCSGSMSGPPINASRAFMHEALDGLRANDTFRVIRFSDSATEFSENALLASAENLARGHEYVEELNSEGGTEMTAGIRQALASPIEDGRLRIVVFLTDGYVGNDFEVIQLVDELRGEARIYSIGVGGSVNRFILDEVAKMGRGRAEYLTTSAGMDAQARSLALRIAAPVLTNITLDLADANVLDIYPRDLPDLFQGQAVRAIGRIQGRWSGQGAVHGLAVSGAVDVPVLTSVSGDEARLVGRTWARQRIAELNHQMLTSPDDHSDLVAEVTEIGLGWSLMTQWTSFVAVSNKPAAAPGAQANTWFEPDVHGTPEPSMLLTGLMAAGAAFASRRRRRKEAADIE
jgi:Ca-activated chloride channel family protein